MTGIKPHASEGSPTAEIKELLETKHLEQDRINPLPHIARALDIALIESAE